MADRSPRFRHVRSVAGSYRLERPNSRTAVSQFDVVRTRSVSAIAVAHLKAAGSWSTEIKQVVRP